MLKNCEINGYFGFTLQLSEASGAWDEIAPYRFAALNADERVLDAEDIDVPQDLTEPGNNPVDNSFSLPSGTYTLTVNLGNRTLTVSGEVIEEPYEPTGEMYILGEMNGNSWGSNVGVKMETADIKPVTGSIALEYPLDGDFTQYAEVDVPEAAPEVYVMGQVNGNGWDTNVGVKMENTEGKIYVLKNCEINGYFGFTLQLSEASGAWDEIAMH